MTPSPSPVDCYLDADQAEAGRKLDCSHTSTCLSIAIAAGWNAFTCAGCNAYEPPDLESVAGQVRAVRDHLGLVQLGRVAGLDDG